MVHFKLSANYSSYGDNIFVYGKFCPPGSDHCKMTFNHDKGLYEAAILLKQGWYDYCYITVNNNWPDITAIEGSHYETVNTYSVFVYITDFRTGYQRLASYKTTESR